MDLSSLWKQTKQLLENSVSSIDYSTWIEPTMAVKIDGHDLILMAENDYAKEQLESKYLRLMKNAFREVSNQDFDISVVTEEICRDNQMPADNTPLDPNLNPKYVFETFVVGNSNRMAHAASLAVAEAPAKAYNPLFLYGNVGLGKTHLMHSIAHYILAKNPSAKVLYVTRETFTNELINSISNNKNEEFRNKYRNIDVLLIDDI